MKRFLTTLLAIALALSCLSLAVAEDKPDTWIADRTITIQCYVDDIGYTLPDDVNATPVMQKITELTGIKLDLRYTPGESDETVMAAQPAAGNIPDAIVSYLNNSTRPEFPILLKAAKEGLFADLNPYLADTEVYSKYLDHDYLPADCFRVVVEPDRVMEEGRTARTLFLESVTAMLDREEGHPKQAKLMREDGHLSELLNTRRTAAVYSLFRTSRELAHKMRVKFTLESAPMYLGDMGELVRELKRFRQTGGSALLYGGESADGLLQSLQDEIRCTLAEELTREAEPGEVLILKESLPRGFVCPAQKLMVLTGSELFGKRMSRPRKTKSGLKFSDLTVGD